jgi:hypothetical protein
MDRVPFLLPFARAIENDAKIPGRYDAALGLRVVEGADGPVPVISLRGSQVRAITKTDAVRERDQEDQEISGAVAAITKTAQRREEDDEDISAVGALLTKTEAARERDDDDIVLAQLTKSLNAREKDDE